MDGTVTTYDVGVRVIVAELAPRLFIASASVAGLTIRGGTRDSAVEALQSFFQTLGGASGNTDDAKIACSLMLAGTTLDNVAGQISENNTRKRR